LKNEHSKVLKGLETKEKAGISHPAVCIGDNNATNLELLLSEEYYTETMQTYFNIRKFLNDYHISTNSFPA